MKDPKTKLQEESLRLISSHFGENTRKLYEKKFIGKSDALVLIMTRELLGEYLGHAEMELQMNFLYKLTGNNESK